MRKRKLLIPSTIAILTLGAAVVFIALTSTAHRLRRNSEATDLEKAKSVDQSPLTQEGKPSAIGQPGGDLSGSAGASQAGGGPALHGKVTDEGDKGLPRAKIFVQPSKNLLKDGWDRVLVFRDRLLEKENREKIGLVAEAMTDAGGFYSIPISAIPPGNYRVVAAHDNYEPKAAAWQWTAESSELDFRLNLADPVTGLVLNPEHEPIPNAIVEAYKESEKEEGKKKSVREETKLVSRAEADSAGRFSIGLPEGKFRLIASAKGFAKGVLSGIASGTKDVEIVLGHGRNLACHVVDEGGGPVDLAHLSLFGESAKETSLFKKEAKSLVVKGDSIVEAPGSKAATELARRVLHLTQSPQSRGETDGDGRFRFEDLSRGNYVVIAEKDGYQPAAMNAKLEPKLGAASVEVALLKGKLVTGTVTDTSGKPVPKAFVALSEDKNHESSKPHRKAQEKKQESSVQRKQPADEGKAQPDSGQTKKPRLPKLVSEFRIDAAQETDGAGEFHFDTLRKGLYTLTVEANGFLKYQKEGIQVDDPARVDVVLDPGIQLVGKVLSSTDDTPVPRAKIRFALGEMDRREAQSDDEGHYQIGGLSSGRIKEVELRAAHFSVLVATGLEIASSPSKQTRDFRLEATGKLGGNVTDGKGNAVANARVEVTPTTIKQTEKAHALWHVRERQWAQSVQGRTDAEGNFSLPEVNAGPSLQISIQHPEFKPFHSDPIALKPGEKREGLSFRLEAAARVEVLVQGAGAPVHGAEVKLALKSPPFLTQEGTQPGDKVPSVQKQTSLLGLGKVSSTRTTVRRSTGPDGKAVFSSLEGGSYNLTVLAKAYQPFYSQAQANEDQINTVFVELLPENTISGVVQDHAGAAIAGAHVVASRPAKEGTSEERSSGKSDAGGSFRVGSLGEGSYVLQAHAAGFAEAVLAADVNTNVTVELLRLGAVSGRVLAAETGEPVSNFEVRWKPDGWTPPRASPETKGKEGSWQASERQDFSDPDGAFRLSNIAPGDYLLRVTAQEHSGSEVRLTVHEGAVESVSVLLEEGLSVSGVVLSKVGSLPISGAQIYLLPHNPSKNADLTGKERRAKEEEKRQKVREDRLQGIQHSEKNDAAHTASILAKIAGQGRHSLAVSDQDGNFKLKDVPPGRYYLVVSHEAFVPGNQSIILGGDNVALAVRVDLDKGEELSGTVTRGDGSKVVGAFVTLTDSYGLVKRGETDKTGRYDIQGLVSGAYRFSLRDGEALGQSQDVVVRSGSNRFDYKVGAGGSGSKSSGVERAE